MYINCKTNRENTRIIYQKKRNNNLNKIRKLSRIDYKTIN